MFVFACVCVSVCLLKERGKGSAPCCPRQGMRTYTHTPIQDNTVILGPSPTNIAQSENSTGNGPSFTTL